MRSSKEIRAVLDWVLNTKFEGNVNQMAKATGVVQSSLNRYFRGSQEGMNSDTLAKVMDYVGGRICLDAVYSPEYSFIRKVAAKPAAGGGSLETSGHIEDLLAFKTSWLASRTTSGIDNLCAMDVPSDSMEPVMFQGDTILVDQGEAARELLDGKIYVVRVGCEIFVKRYRKGVGKMLFMGDNPERSYQNFEIKISDADGFQVIGRVFWVGREL